MSGFSSEGEFCLSAEAIFRSSLTSSSSSSSGLFCVLTDNYPGRVEFSDPQILFAEEDLLAAVELQLGPGDAALSSPSFAPPSHQQYLSGDPVQVRLSSGLLTFLPFPASLNNEMCHDGNPVTYLQDGFSVCERSTASHCMPGSGLDANTYYRSLSLLRQPFGSLINIDLLDLTCLNSIGQPVSCDSNEPPVPTYNHAQSTCSHAVKEISYSLAHSSEDGIVAAHASIAIGPVVDDSFLQTFSVHFGPPTTSVINPSTSLATTVILASPTPQAKRSGSDGYLDGSPVLAGFLMGNTVRVSGQSSEWLTILTSGSNCQDIGERLSVSFRQDLQTSCVFR